MRTFIEKIKGDFSPNQNQAWEKLQNLKFGKLDGLELSGAKKVSMKINLDEHILPECKNSNLVFINGHFDPEISNAPGLNLSSFEKALTTYGSFLQNRLQQLLKKENDPIALINLTLSETSAFLYLPPNSVVKTPLQVIFVSSCDNSNVIINPRLQIFAGKNSKLNIIFSNVDLKKPPLFNNQFLDLVIEEGASLKSQNSSKKKSKMHFETLRATLKKNSSYEHIFITNSLNDYRSDFDLSLEGENANANIFGLALLNGEQVADTNVVFRHLAPHCQSKQLIKKVLSGKSRSSFKGKIYIDTKAYKTKADQKNHNLLLSDDASAKSNPTLEIFADDVKASHGATFGRLDNDSLFYLKSRGLTEENAKELLIEAFCSEIKEKIC